MKIIDNKKDYYDYLMGVYGIDNKIIYDRRNSSRMDDNIVDFDKIKKESYEIILRIGYYLYTIIKDNKTGEWIMPNEKVTRKRGIIQTLKNPEFIINNYDCPLFISIKCGNIWNSSSIDYKNPIILSFSPFIKFAKFIPAETIWRQIYDYLSSQFDKEIKDNRTDIQKLESAGFDKKTSFRK